MTRDQALAIFSRGFEAFRLRNGLTLDQLGQILGCGRANVHKIKTGKNFPSMEGLFSRMTLYEIFGTELAEKLTAEMKEVLPEPGKKDMFDTPEMREIIAKTIGELVEKGYKAINPLK